MFLRFDSLPIEYKGYYFYTCAACGYFAVITGWKALLEKFSYIAISYSDPLNIGYFTHISQLVLN